MRIPFISLLVAAGVSLGCLAPLDSDRAVPKARGDHAALFIGNSHTYVHDVPGMVEALARAAGDSAFEAHAVAEPNYALGDHLATSRAPAALQGSRWRWVVLQQGTSALAESQIYLENVTLAFDPLIRGAGAEPVLYQIWPTASRRFDADAALTSYWNAAAAVGGILAPAGDAFTASLDSDPSVPVYDGDGLHASRYGAYLAAVVLVERMLGVHPESLPPRIPGMSADTNIVRHLQRAAAAATSRNPARPILKRAPPKDTIQAVRYGMRTTASVRPADFVRSSSSAASP